VAAASLAGSQAGLDGLGAACAGAKGRGLRRSVGSLPTQSVLPFYKGADCKLQRAKKVPASAGELRTGDLAEEHLFGCLFNTSSLKTSSGNIWWFCCF